MGVAWADEARESWLDRRSIRIGAPVVWLAGLIAFSLTVHVPLSRGTVVPWILGGLLAFSIANPKRWLRGVIVDWLPFASILFAYDALRGVADGLLLPAHVRPQLEADQDLFGGTAPTVWLQHHLFGGADHLRWYDYGVWGVYVTHFFATLVLAGVLWLVAHDQFRRWMAMVCLLALMGFVTYVLFPAAPPWLASEGGHLPATHRIVQDVFHNVPGFGTVFDSGRKMSNDVAAMPSLHAAYALLLAVFLWPLVGRRWRPLLALYPLAMAFALVYTAEHYVADVLAGWVYAAIAYAAVDWALARREAPAPALAPATG
jgi:membrane-associated phospholipid phosphatase